jgi:hypothetical protein
MHAQNMEPWYWTLLWLPDAVQLTNQRRRLGGRTGCRSLEKFGYDTLERVEQHAMTDVKGVPLASYDMHVRLQIYWISLHCLMPRLAREDQIALCGGSFGLQDQQAPTRYCMATTTFQGYVHASVRMA